MLSRILLSTCINISVCSHLFFIVQVCFYLRYVFTRFKAEKMSSLSAFMACESKSNLFCLTYYEASTSLHILQFFNNGAHITASLSLSSNKLGIPSRHEMSLRDLNQISIERDISETSQKHLKRDVFFVTSLRGLKYISKNMSFL